MPPKSSLSTEQKLSMSLDALLEVDPSVRIPGRGRGRGGRGGGGGGAGGASGGRRGGRGSLFNVGRGGGFRGGRGRGFRGRGQTYAPSFTTLGAVARGRGTFRRGGFGGFVRPSVKSISYGGTTASYTRQLIAATAARNAILAAARGVDLSGFSRGGGRGFGRGRGGRGFGRGRGGRLSSW